MCVARSRRDGDGGGDAAVTVTATVAVVMCRGEDDVSSFTRAGLANALLLGRRLLAIAPEDKRRQ